jgi:hypothetical protein
MMLVEHNQVHPKMVDEVLSGQEEPVSLEHMVVQGHPTVPKDMEATPLKKMRRRRKYWKYL